MAPWTRRRSTVMKPPSSPPPLWACREARGECQDGGRPVFDKEAEATAEQPSWPSTRFGVPESSGGRRLDAGRLGRLVFVVGDEGLVVAVEER